MTSRMVPEMTIDHLDQLLFSTLSCIMLLSWSRTQGSLCSPWSCEGQGRMTMTSIMVPNMIFDHLEQLLFSKHCSKLLYLENAVKFSSQEHSRPPRIQEEKSGFDSRFPKSRLDLMGKQLQDQQLTSRKPQRWPFSPILEGKMTQNLNSLTGADAWPDRSENFFGTPWHTQKAIGMGFRLGTQLLYIGG